MWIKWADSANDDLANIFSYSDLGNKIVRNILRSIARLAQYPLIGRRGRIDGTRELVITSYPYIVVYRVRGDSVRIVRIIHTSRLFPDKLT